MTDNEKAGCIVAGLILLWLLAKQRSAAAVGTTPSAPTGAGGRFGGAGNTGGW